MLKGFKLPFETIRCGDQQFQVTGMSVDTISSVMTSGQRADVDAAVAKLSEAYQASRSKDDPRLQQVLTSLVVQMPGLAAAVIAAAAGEPEEAEVVRRLPVTVQLDALLAIGRLTFDGEDAIKKFVGGLTAMMSGMTRAAQLAKDQLNSIGGRA